MWHGVPFACQRRPIIGVLRMCWLLEGSFDCFCCPHTSVHRPSIACLAVFLCGPGAAPPPSHRHALVTCFELWTWYHCAAPQNAQRSEHPWANHQPTATSHGAMDVLCTTQGMACPAVSCHVGTTFHLAPRIWEHTHIALSKEHTWPSECSCRMLYIATSRPPCDGTH